MICTITIKYILMAITELISITCVITKSESERWKLLCTVVHVDLSPEQVFEDMKLSTAVVDLRTRRRESNDYLLTIFSGLLLCICDLKRIQQTHQCCALYMCQIKRRLKMIALVTISSVCSRL